MRSEWCLTNVPNQDGHEKMIKIYYSIACSILLLIAPVTHAYNAYYPKQQTTQEDPVVYIQDALEKLEKFTSNVDKVNPILLKTFIETEIIPHFSFDDMSRWITGPFSQRMTKADKAEFQTKLKSAFLNSLAKHLGSFDTIKDRVRFYPTRNKGRDEAVVSARVYRSNDYPAKLDFRMRLIDSDWKIVDVSANGTSAVVYYRQHFMSELRQYNRR